MLVPCAAAASMAHACAMCKLDFLPCRSQWAPQLCGPLATQPEPRSDWERRGSLAGGRTRRQAGLHV